MHNAFFRVPADVRLEPDVPLLSLARLVHFRIALAALVLHRLRRMDQGRIDDRTGRNADALRGQILVHRLQHLPAQIVLFQ